MKTLETPLFFRFMLGLVLGAALDYPWRKTGVNKYERKLEALEHYHWGLVSLIVAKLFNFGAIYAGVGLYLIPVELTQKHPFAIKSNHDLPSTVIGLILVAILIFAFIIL